MTFWTHGPAPYRTPICTGDSPLKIFVTWVPGEERVGFFAAEDVAAGGVEDFVGFAGHDYS